MEAQGVQESQRHGRTVSYHIQNRIAQHLFSQDHCGVRGDWEPLERSWRGRGTLICYISIQGSQIRRPKRQEGSTWNTVRNVLSQTPHGLDCRQ